MGRGLEITCPKETGLAFFSVFGFLQGRNGYLIRACWCVPRKAEHLAPRGLIQPDSDGGSS